MADRSSTSSKFVALCLCARFPPGWFCVNGKHPGLGILVDRLRAV